MNGRELTAAIHKMLCSGIKTDADREECLIIDTQWRNFIETASEDEIVNFQRQTIGLEAFSMIVEGIKYDADPKKYEEQWK